MQGLPIATTATVAALFGLVAVSAFAHESRRVCAKGYLWEAIEPTPAYELNITIKLAVVSKVLFHNENAPNFVILDAMKADKGTLHPNDHWVVLQKATAGTWLQAPRYDARQLRLLEKIDDRNHLCAKLGEEDYIAPILDTDSHDGATRFVVISQSIKKKQNELRRRRPSPLRRRD